MVQKTPSGHLTYKSLGDKLHSLDSVHTRLSIIPLKPLPHVQRQDVSPAFSLLSYCGLRDSLKGSVNSPVALCTWQSDCCVLSPVRRTFYTACHGHCITMLPLKRLIYPAANVSGVTFQCYGGYIAHVEILLRDLTLLYS